MLDEGFIRRIDIHDLDKIVEIEKKCFDHNIAYSRQQLKYLITRAKSNCFVEVNNDLIRGFIITLNRQRTGVVGIETLNVDPEFHGKGIGRKLLIAAEETIFNSGVKKIRLEVSMGNLAAIKLYEKSGFRITAILENYYIFEHHGTKNAYRMIKQLTT